MSEQNASDLMVLTAWVEEGSEKPLRVRIRTPNRVGSKDKYVADSSDVAQLVKDWLDSLLQPPS